MKPEQCMCGGTLTRNRRCTSCLKHRPAAVRVSDPSDRLDAQWSECCERLWGWSPYAKDDYELHLQWQRVGYVVRFMSHQANQMATAAIRTGAAIQRMAGRDWVPSDDDYRFVVTSGGAPPSGVVHWVPSAEKPAGLVSPAAMAVEAERRLGSGQSEADDTVLRDLVTSQTDAFGRLRWRYDSALEDALCDMMALDLLHEKGWR